MTSTDGATVFIIDDDARMRAATQRLLKSAGLHTESFPMPDDFLRCVLPDGPSCLALDVRLPLIFITGHGDIPMTVKAMKSGGMGFLTKPFRDQGLLDAIQQALERPAAVRQQHCEMAELRERYKSLAAREREVMKLVVSGMLTRQIASTLGISEITATVHCGHAMRKMQAN